MQNGSHETLVIRMLEALATKVDSLATKEELREIRSQFREMIPRSEFDSTLKASERDMIELKESLKQLHRDVSELRKKIEEINERKVPHWITSSFFSIIVSIITLFIAWAVNHGEIPIKP